VISNSPLFKSPHLLKRDFKLKGSILVIEDKSLRRRPNGITTKAKQNAFSVKLFESQQS